MRTAIALLAAVTFTVVAAAPAVAADDAKVKSATSRTETGAKKIGAAKVGEGVSDTAKSIGKPVPEGRGLGLLLLIFLAARDRI